LPSIADRGQHHMADRFSLYFAGEHLRGIGFDIDKGAPGLIGMGKAGGKAGVTVDAAVSAAGIAVNGVVGQAGLIQDGPAFNAGIFNRIYMRSDHDCVPHNILTKKSFICPVISDTHPLTPSQTAGLSKLKTFLV
jgi:hypothetical protein